MANAAGETVDPKEPKDAAGDEGADDKLNKLVNAAVSSHLKRHLKALEGSFGSMLEEKLAGIAPRKEPAEQPAKTGKPASKDKDGDGDGDGYDAKGEIEALRNELKAERAKAREKEVLADVKSGLAGKVKPEAMGAALRLLRDRISIKGSNVTFKNDEGESVDLDDGVAEWLKSPEGALFAAPPAPAARKPQTGPKAPPRPAPSGKDENLTPAQKSLRDFERLGLK